jgi:hypothetical protein
VLCGGSPWCSHGLVDVVGVPAWMREFIHPCACCDVQPCVAHACKMARLAVLCPRGAFICCFASSHSQPRRLAARCLSCAARCLSCVLRRLLTSDACHRSVHSPCLCVGNRMCLVQPHFCLSVSGACVCVCVCVCVRGTRLKNWTVCALVF